jgi:hypothetical protein
MKRKYLNPFFFKFLCIERGPIGNIGDVYLYQGRIIRSEED